MTRPPKPYLGARRTDLSKSLRDLADELDRTDAEATQRGLIAAVDDCYSATASGAGVGGGAGGEVTLTAVEAKASRRDPAAGPAAIILLRLRRIERDAEEALLGLTSWDFFRNPLTFICQYFSQTFSDLFGAAAA